MWAVSSSSKWERNCMCQKKKKEKNKNTWCMCYGLACVCVWSHVCLTCVNVFLSLNRQELPTVAPPTPIHHCRHYPYLCLKHRHFFPRIGDFFSPLFSFSSQCCHKRPKSVGDIRVERAPRWDRSPSALTVPQFICAMDRQALQVVLATTTASSGSWDSCSGLTLGQLWFCKHREEKVH